MAHDTALAAITLPDSSDVADVPTVLAAMVGDIESKLIVPMSHATRAGLSAAADGLAVWETDLHKLYIHQGTDPASGWFEVAAYDSTNSTWDLPAKPWGLPWGIPTGGYVERTADAGGATSITLITITLTLTAGRRTKITGQADVFDTDARDGGVELAIKDGGTQLQRSVLANFEANIGDTQHLGVVKNLSGGSHTFTLQVASQSGYNVGISAGATRPAYLCIEDMGPA